MEEFFYKWKLYIVVKSSIIKLRKRLQGMEG